MPPPQELILRYGSGLWTAEGQGLCLSASELGSLERAIGAALRARRRAPADVVLRFDLASLPRWLRQYQSHYFNYVLHVRAEAEVV